jgi:YHS domain-containing protein
MKKIVDFIDELPEPYRSKALHNVQTMAGAAPNTEAENHHSAISRAFIWGLSPEGQEYWEDFFNSLRKEHFKKNPEKNQEKN